RSILPRLLPVGRRLSRLLSYGCRLIGLESRYCSPFLSTSLSHMVFRNGLTFYRVHIQSQRLCRAKLGITYYSSSLILLILYRLYYTNTNFSEGIGTLFLKKNIKKLRRL